ncbi:iron-containing alcohol dehydrogenase [Dehalococcoidia bacterium]|nr:iron-containing alcohol dehydrogenase [Dehalococcoidia bacterium]
MEFTTSFRYLNPGARIYAGKEVISQIDREVQRLGTKRAFVVMSPTVNRETNLLEKIKNSLGDLYVGVYDGANRETLIPTVDAGVAAARKAAADVIIAVGGGSAVCTARAITIMLAEGGSYQDLSTKHTDGKGLTSPRLLQPKLPNILILTTPTTAADRGGVAVRDSKRPFRLELYDPKVRPQAIVLDEDALLTAPVSLFLDTSAHTLASLIKRFVKPQNNGFNFADIRQALELSIVYMPQLLENPADPTPRIQLGLAALLANRAEDAPSVETERGGNAFYLQLCFHYDHVGMGMSRTALLSSEMRKLGEEISDGKMRLLQMFEKLGHDTQGKESSEVIASFLGSLGLPTRLQELGIPESDFQLLAEEESAEPSVDAGPDRMRDVGELVEVLKEAW